MSITSTSTMDFADLTVCRVFVGSR